MKKIDVTKLFSDTLPAMLTFLETSQLLKWSKQVTNSCMASISDKALDAEYLRSHIGGGDHRLFDGGHDVVSAWKTISETYPEESLNYNVCEYSSALWKDVTTTKGLPFATLSKDGFDSAAQWVSKNTPVNREWLYDLVSFDCFEVIGASMAMAGAIFFFKKEDYEKLSELIGNMGIVAITSANFLMGIAAIFIIAYAYFVKKQAFVKKDIIMGASMAIISATIFHILGLPILIELGIVIVINMLIRHVISKEIIQDFIKSKIALFKDGTTRIPTEETV